MTAHLLDVAGHRGAVRAGAFAGPTAGQLPGVAQANLVAVPAGWAGDLAAFAAANPRPCPVVDRTGPGDPHPPRVAPAADLRTDVPRYRVFVDGAVVAEPTDVRDWWRDDLVAFLLGCSFTFERALAAAGVPLRHVKQGRNVPMYVTERPCVPAGRLAGPLVVSMRPVPGSLVDRARAVTAPFTLAHGAPVHAGDPGALGIADLDRPHYGDAVRFQPGDVPVFWACGVTPQAVLLSARPPLAITHAPGHMFVTDLPDAALADGPVSSGPSRDVAQPG